MKLYTNLFLFLALISLCGDTAASQTSISNAVVTLRKIIIDVPSDPVALQIYEKKQAMPIVQCAKIVYDTVYAQILETLQDIDNRLAYWQDRKNHPWKYFFTKNPLKWVTGVPQNVEVEDNIEQLQSNQGELYVLLGQLAEHGNVYDREYKTIFVADYTKAYAWVDGLLDLLPRIKVPVKNLGDMSPFLARVTLLKAKLEKVRFFKNQILAEMKDTQIPATLERNWLKYSAAGLFLGLGYNHAGQIGEFAAGSFDWTKNYMFETAHSINQFFFPPKIIDRDISDLVVKKGNIAVAQSAMINFLDTMEKSKIITAAEKNIIIADEARGSSAEFQKFMYDKILSSYWNLAKYGTQAVSIFIQLFSLQGGKNVEETVYKVLSEFEEQLTGVRRIGFIGPTVLAAGLVGVMGYFGYKKATAKDYTPLRRAVVDIGSLFVDATKPLDDEQYGKMLYLIYNLKKRAVKDIPLVDRDDFLHDLNRIESKEFGVAAKRAIVDDMFRKYSFLKLV